MEGGLSHQQSLLEQAVEWRWSIRNDTLPLSPKSASLLALFNARDDQGRENDQ